MDLNRPDFDEYIHELCKKPIEEIVDEVAEDYTLRSYLASCAENYRNGADFDRYNYENRDPGHDWDWCHFWETTQFLTGWTWKDREEFETEADRKSIAFWAPKILRALSQRMNSQHARDVQEEIDRKDKEIEEKRRKETLAMFVKSIPEEFRGASIDDWKEENAKKLIAALLSGGSFLIWGGRGIGKTRLMYAVMTKMLEDGKEASKYYAPAYISGLLAMSSAHKTSVYDIIDSHTAGHKSVLFLDEGDKLTNDTQKEILNYLIDKRYENHLQTIMICNAIDEGDLEAKLTSSVISRFKSKSWKARTLHLNGEDKRQKEAP